MIENRYVKFCRYEIFIYVLKHYIQNIAYNVFTCEYVIMTDKSDKFNLPQCKSVNDY